MIWLQLKLSLLFLLTLLQDTHEPENQCYKKAQCDLHLVNNKCCIRKVHELFQDSLRRLE